MSDVAIKVEDLSKLYRLGEIGTGTISHDLNRWWARVRGREDPFAKLGETNDRTSKGSDYVWSLKDLNFEVKQGEVLGIIGRNGAGKSTLLKILSKVTAPTTGRIKVQGRIASLLEVGTGFHPELTGRENIYLNGAILGMTKAEIRSKFDEIVDFSGVERYIDTPVKRYSSGMYVRLAFAVAAFLEPEILIVDEVLAVGDAEFQKKCLGRMKDVSVNDGRTVLFVSHNMGAIVQLCTKATLLRNGNIIEFGNTEPVLATYLDIHGSATSGHFKSLGVVGKSDITEVYFSNSTGKIINNFGFDESVIINFVLSLSSKLAGLFLSFRVVDRLERSIFSSEVAVSNFITEPGVHKLKSVIPSSILVPGSYSLFVALHIPGLEMIKLIENEPRFVIEETGSKFSKYEGTDYGCVNITCEWIESSDD